MDESFGGDDGRLRVPITESTMMSILHSAMDRAQEKVKSKEGVLERLSERSKFCELAILQLEGCLKFVQEETDRLILERDHEKVLADLTETRDRLQWRLEETEFAILMNDKKLTEISENESELRQALEVKERELASLRASLVLEKLKSDVVPEFNMTDPKSGVAGRDGEFSELKLYVHQQFWNIKQKLEDERMNLTKINLSPSNSLNQNSELVDEIKHGMEDEEIELQEVDRENEIKTSPYSSMMGSDIDTLKETFDLAFGRMHNAIYLSELGPLEKQWRWMIEKDTMSILVKGFMGDLQHNFEVELMKREKQVSFGLLCKHWSDLMNDVISLRRELESLNNENEVQVSNARDHDTLVNSLDMKISQNAGAKLSSDGESGFKSANSFSQLKKDVEEFPAEDPSGNGSHYVLKMIQNHESIIREKSEELNLLKVEILPGKDSSTIKRDEDPNNQKRRINEVIVKIDTVIRWNAKLGLGDTLSDKVRYEKENSSEKCSSESSMYDGEKMGMDTMADTCEIASDVEVCHPVYGELDGEIKKLKSEIEDSNLQSLIQEETYVLLFRGLIKELYIELYNNDIGSMVRDEKEDNNTIEIQNKGDERETVCNESMKHIGFSPCFKTCKCLDVGDESNFLENSASAKNLSCNLEAMIREEVVNVVFQETVKEWNKELEINISESVVREEISQIVFGEVLKSIIDTANSALHRYHEVNVPDNSDDLPLASELFLSVESFVKEEVYTIFFREMINDWRMEIDAQKFEIFIKEEIYQFILFEAVKDTHSIEIEACSNPGTYSQNFLCVEELCVSPEEGREEKDLIPSLCSEIKEHNSGHSDNICLEPVELDDHGIFEELSNDDEGAFISVSRKLERALQQLVSSNGLLNELEYSSEHPASETEKVHDQTIQQDRDHPFCQPKETTAVQLNSSDLMLLPLVEFSQVFLDFEHSILEKLELSNSRLEDVKLHLVPLAGLVASLTLKESVYRKAFMKRCQNMQKAEIEVDLLGDQVDALLSLLHKIYMALHDSAPVLQHHFKVSEILKLIENELSGEAAHELS